MNDLIGLFSTSDFQDMKRSTMASASHSNVTMYSKTEKRPP